jgi:hypothetical protein
MKELGFEVLREELQSFNIEPGNKELMFTV